MLLLRSKRFLPGFVRLLAVAAAILVLSVLVVSRSQAAFSGTTDNTSNSFSTGSVTLTDDDASSAMFTTTGMSPGNPSVKCISVTYSGSLTPAAIRLYGTSSGALAPYLNTTIEVGTGGTFASCTGFSATSTLFSGTLASFTSTHTNWSSGLASFTAASNPTSRTFRFTVDVQNNPSAQSASAAATFTWEAQN